MARKANYGFEKRQRELEKKKKKEAKREAKRLAKEAAAAARLEGTEAGADGEAEFGDGTQTDPASGSEADGVAEDGTV